MRPDNNNSVLDTDTLIIVYSITIPEGTYQENFTVGVETEFGESNGFSGSPSPSLSNSAPLMVILEPLLTVQLDVSHR